MKFEPVVANQDLDVHPDPSGRWARVAVVCRWKDAHAFRKQWPHAAVVGPLRTLRGIDELVRNLLHNPQIRLIVICGNDLTPGEETTKALLDTWRGPDWSDRWDKHVGEDVRPHLKVVTNGVSLATPEGFKAEWGLDYVGDADREGGCITLPPPPPTATAPAPHGDPGERVAAGTLSELWPMLLHRTMRFGRIMPTQYGDTREVLNLVSVIRDPVASLAEIKGLAPPVPAGTWVVGYRKVCTRCEGVESDTCGLCHGFGQVVEPFVYPDGPDNPKGVPGYIGKSFWEFHPDEASAECSYREHERLGTASVLRPFHRTAGPDMAAWAEQHAAKHPVLGISWAEVEAYRDRVTRPEIPEGAPYSYGSRMRGRPKPEDLGPGRDGHLTGAEWAQGPDQIEHIAGLLYEKPDTRAAFLTPWRPLEDSGKESGRPCLVGVWFRVVTTPGVLLPDLHMTVTFRSHCLYAGWPTNLAGLCLWLVEEAERLGMAVGTLTCMSMSAHLYAKDWNAAEGVISKHYDSNREPSWDQRSSWRVERFEGEALDIGEYANPTFRATALTPGGSEVIAVFEASTPESLRTQIEKSGLVTSTGAALWLGDEIRRVAGK